MHSSESSDGYSSGITEILYNSMSAYHHTWLILFPQRTVWLPEFQGNYQQKGVCKQ